MKSLLLSLSLVGLSACTLASVAAQEAETSGKVRTVSAEQPPLIEPLQSSPDLDFKSLLKPRFSLQAEWEPEADELGIASYDLTATIPTYPFFGPPPPLLSGGAGLTMLYAPARYRLPDDLFDFTLGGAWIRPITREVGRIPAAM